jgi:glyoxylase-like metal-dependent hydrolase (beta-lactamase superfamily II)
MRELTNGLWHWEARHPGWEEGEPWNPSVSSYAIDDGDRLLLFDPLDVPDELEQLARERDTAIVLTSPWHERSSEGLVERLGVPVYTPLPDTAEDLMRKWGISAERAGDGSPDCVWLLKEGKGEAHPFKAGDHLDVGVDAYPGQKDNDLLLWVPSHNALVVGDTIADFGDGPQINPRWFDAEMTRERLDANLRPLLDLPVEHLLATHGGPHGRETLEQAIEG